jgi:hypothetical protein
MITLRSSLGSTVNRRRRTALRLDTFEDRTLPAVSLGTAIIGGSGNSFAPPDTDGTIGPNHYVQFINGRFAIYNKSTGALISAVSDTSFWNSAGISSSLTGQGLSDTRIMYDPLSSRWFAVEITTANSGNSVLIARSNSTDPTAGWKATSYVLDIGTDGFSDYPTLGVDGNAVYIGINFFANNGSLIEVITSIPKADLLLTIPTANNSSTRADQQNANTIGYTLQGVNNFNAGQTSSSFGSIFAVDFNVFSQLDWTLVTGSGAPGASFGTTIPLAVQTTASPLDAHQPDGTAEIDALDGRIQSSVFQVGDLIFGAVVTPNAAGNRDAIRISVLSVSSATIVAEATISDNTFDYIDPSLAMNAEGDMIIGFTRSAAAAGSGATDGHLGAYAEYAHIDPNNPAAGITLGPVLQAQVGKANYHLFGGSGERWGDFSATDVDPNNPTAFWTTQEYAETPASTWGTAIRQVFVSPRVSQSTGVTSTAADGTYTIGQVIPITVTFNDAVTVNTAGGTPTLALNPGGGATAIYASGSGTKTLTFNYTVGSGQASPHLDYSSTTALTLNGGTIKDTASALDAILTLASPGASGSLGASKNIVIDTTPRITGGVSATNANATYTTGDVIHVTVTFSSPVNVTGTPKLALNASAGAAANYVSGSGSATLTFDYTVAVGDTTSGGDLDYASTTALTLNGGTIKDSGTGVDAILTLAAPGTAGSLGANKNIVIDTTVAVITGISSTQPNGSYGFGTLIPITITFSQPVLVTGVPQLALNDGPSALANYSSGSGTVSLTFNYTVGAGDFTPDLDYASTTALSLNGGTIVDQANGGNATLTLPAPGATGSLGANKNLAIDALPAQATNVTSTTADGSYGFGNLITITVGFSKAVTVTGTPQLALNSGGSAVASYGSGSGTKTLTFQYSVGLGDLSADLDYTSTTALTGTIEDQASGVNAALTLPAPGATGSLGANKNIAVDGRPAQPSNITSPQADGTYSLSASITITVTFTHPVNVTGIPQLALNSGGTANYLSGDGTSTLTFTYTVGSGENSSDLDYTSTTALGLNGGTITDQASGANATLTLPAPETSGSLGANKNIVIDSTPPHVLNVTSTSANNTYGIGASVVVTLQYNKPVTVTGVPLLSLNSGGTASFTSATATTLTFTYTVAAGENSADLDYSSSSALSLNGGTIVEQGSGQNASLTLPAPGTAGSLGANKNIIIDTAGPKVVHFRVLFGLKSYDLIGSSRTDLPWRITGIQVVFDEPVMSGNIHSLSGLTANKFTGSKTNTLTWKFPAKLKGTFNATLLATGANALKDGSGNPIDPFSKAFAVLYGDFNDDQVVNAVDENGVRALGSAPYNLNSPAYSIFADLSGDGLVNLIDVGIAHTRKGNSLP